jgi:preprotein translocase subunit SecE
MASKATLVNGEQRPSPGKLSPVKREPNAVSNLVGRVVGVWTEFRRFLTDVRAEMRKVVTPTRKEVEATTSVVIIAVFLFGVYFLLVDAIFKNLINQLLSRLGGLQQ